MDYFGLMALTSEFYALLAVLLTLTVSCILLLLRLDKFTAQVEAAAKRQDEAEQALREHTKLYAEKVEQRLARAMDADAKSHVSLEGLLRAQHAAVEANSRATEQLTGAVRDLQAALVESTKL